jgi:hypothetical protein
MSNLSDKDIDRLSRDAAEFYEPDDSMLSWNKLEQQLIEHIPERPPDAPSFFRIRPLIWGPGILLLTGITYFLIKNGTHRSYSTLKTQSENISGKTAGNAPAKRADADRLPDHTTGTADPGSTKAGPATAAVPETGADNKPMPDLSAAGASATGSANRSANESASASVIGSKIRIDKIHSGINSRADGISTESGSSRPDISRNKENRHGKSHTAAAGSNGEEAVNNASGNIQNGAAPVYDVSKPGAGYQRSAVVQLPSLFFFKGNPDVRGNDSSLNRFAASNTRQQPKPAKSLRINRSLVVGIVMGPDYTDADGMANNQLSNNLGISIGYYLSRRLSVNTGFQYTRKFYWANGKSFQPSSRPMNPVVTSYAAFPRIETVYGSCSMFEIPLTLRYDFIQHERTKAFIGAGLSSYLLRKQKYTYFFHNAGRAYEWQNENGDHQNYWFGFGDISAGIEQDLGKGISFQAEPFMRMPFQGIGVGNSKMNSFGILFSLRYSPVLGRKRK